MKQENIEITKLTLHPECLNTPSMSSEQYEALKLSIDAYGQLDAITIFRKRIVDGRHRWLVMQELGLTTINTVAMANNSSLQDVKDLVMNKETRRHETTAQLAITAYRLTKTGLTQAAAAKQVGVEVKRVGEAKKIEVTYGRSDILDLIFSGEKLDTGIAPNVFLTDSLGTILRWLAEYGVVKGGKGKVKISPREELTEEEQEISNQIFNTAVHESRRVQKEVSRMLYARCMENDNNK